MCLRSKKDNAGFFLTCLGKPECSHVIWLADVIKEITVTPDECNKCRNGNRKLVIKFKSNNMLAMLNASSINDNDATYESCILCDNSLRVILDINASNLRGIQNPSSNRSQIHNRTIPTQNAQRINTNINTAATRPQNDRPTVPNPRPNQNPNQSFRNAGNVKCSGCNQPALK